VSLNPQVEDSANPIFFFFMSYKVNRTTVDPLSEATNRIEDHPCQSVSTGASPSLDVQRREEIFGIK